MIDYFQWNYIQLVKTILECGVDVENDRTGIGTKKVFTGYIGHDLSQGFPSLTIKKTNYMAAIDEMLWMLRGETNTKTLGSKIWDEWADKDGNLGGIYGKQWRKWPVQNPDGSITYIDQVANVIESIKNNPNSRRHIISGWNVAELPDESLSPQENVANGKMALPPCHMTYQFYVDEPNGHLNLFMHQRSSDVFLGLPFNIIGMATMLYVIADLTGYKPKQIAWTGVDCHLYSNQIEPAKEMLKRTAFDLPTVEYTPNSKVIDEILPSSFNVIGYNHHPAMPVKVAV